MLPWQVLTHPDDQNTQSDTDADAIVADILTIAHSPVFDSVHSRHARRSLADHLVEEAEDWQVPLSEEERLRVASAAFDEHRCVQGRLALDAKPVYCLWALRWLLATASKQSLTSMHQLKRPVYSDSSQC